MEFQKLLGIAVGTAVMCMAVRKLSADSAVYITLAFCILVLGYCVSAVKPLWDYMGELLDNTAYTDSARVIAKACTVGLVTSVTCDICSSCGEKDIARSAELVGKAALVLIALPLIKDLMQTAGSLVMS